MTWKERASTMMMKILTKKNIRLSMRKMMNMMKKILMRRTRMMKV